MLADASHTGGHQHSVSNFDDEDELRSTLVNVRFGSLTEVFHALKKSPLLGGKRTLSAGVSLGNLVPLRVWPLVTVKMSDQKGDPHARFLSVFLQEP